MKNLKDQLGELISNQPIPAGLQPMPIVAAVLPVPIMPLHRIRATVQISPETAITESRIAKRNFRI